MSLREVCSYRFVFGVLCLLLPVYAGEILPDRNVFHVRDVHIASHEESGVKAQVNAKNQALKLGFDRLVRRITLGVPPAYLFAYDAKQITPFVESYNVTNELRANDSYQATFDIVFSKRAILDVFAGADTKAVITTQSPVLLVPVLRQGKTVSIWGAQNTWAEYLKNAKVHSPLQPFRLPRGDLFDMSTWPVTVYPRFRQSVGKSFGSQYYVRRVVVAELTRDAEGQAGLNLVAYDIETGNLLNSQSLNLAATDETAVERQAITYVVDFMESLAKLSRKDVDAAPTQESIVVSVHHNGLDDYEALLDEIVRVRGVAGLQQLRVSTASAHVRVVFATSFEDLIRGFEAKGYTLVRSGQQIMLKRSSRNTDKRLNHVAIKRLQPVQTSDLLA